MGKNNFLNKWFKEWASHKADQLLYTSKNNSEKSITFSPFKYLNWMYLQITGWAVNFWSKNNSTRSAMVKLDNHVILFPTQEKLGVKNECSTLEGCLTLHFFEILSKVMRYKGHGTIKTVWYLDFQNYFNFSVAPCCQDLSIQDNQVTKSA